MADDAQDLRMVGAEAVLELVDAGVHRLNCGGGVEAAMVIDDEAVAGAADADGVHVADVRDRGIRISSY